MNYSEYYKVLKLPENAPFELVKKAYRQYVHLYHPDVCANNRIYVERFKKIQEAYNKLRELSLRSEYIVKEEKVEKKPSVNRYNSSNDSMFRLSKKNKKHSIFKNFKLNFSHNEMNIDIVSRNLSTKELIDRLTSSDNRYVRMAAAKALFPRKNAKNLLYLLSACNDKDEEVSKFVVGLMRNYFDFEGLTYLKKIWEISSQAQRFKLLLIFEKINDPRISAVIKEDDMSYSNFLRKKLNRFFAKFKKEKFSIFENK